MRTQGPGAAEKMLLPTEEKIGQEKKQTRQKKTGKKTRHVGHTAAL